MTSLAEQIKRKKQQMTDKAAGNKNTYRFKQKTTTIRILPTWRPEDHEDPTFYHDFGMTWIKDMDGALLAVVGDRKMTYGEDDEVRNLVERALSQARTDAQRKHFKEMKASPRVLVNALVLDDKDVDPSEPEIVEFSETQFGNIIDQMDIAINSGQDPLDLANGFDIIVGKTGKGIETKYTFVLARNPSSVDPDVMKNINDIDAFIRAKFADGEKARNAIRSLIGDPVVITDRATNMIEDRSSRHTVDTDINDADYSVIDNGDSEVDNVAISEEDIDALLGDV